MKSKPASGIHLVQFVIMNGNDHEIGWVAPKRTDITDQAFLLSSLLSENGIMLRGLCGQSVKLVLFDDSLYYIFHECQIWRPCKQRCNAASQTNCILTTGCLSSCQQ